MKGKPNLRAELERKAAELGFCAIGIARADQQHNWVMQGDDRGTYGPRGSDLMHYIESPGAMAPPR